MKRIALFLTLCAVLFANQPSFLAEQNEIELTKNQCGFDISGFDENPSTGYAWNVSYDDKVFKEPQKEFILSPAQPGMVGVGGKTTFYFALKSRLCNDSNLTSAKLTFKLSRAWENAPVKTKSVEVKFKY